MELAGSGHYFRAEVLHGALYETYRRVLGLDLPMDPM